LTYYGDTWADVYDLTHTLTEDIPFWIEEAISCGGPVLELGSGTGRVSIPIAEAGVPILGIDNSTEMLKLARMKGRKLRLTPPLLRFAKGDMRSFSADNAQFPLVIIPFRAFQSLLSVADQYLALNMIRSYLEPGGRLIVDIFMPDLEMLTEHSSSPVYNHESTELKTGNRTRVWSEYRCDNFNQIINTRWTIEELDANGAPKHKVTKYSQMRYLHRFETQHLLANLGYEVLQIYGGFDREPFSESSTEMIWIATNSG
jgi:ubiquinone/menaquinone biosynthesis C-methylase UbiE